MSDKFIWNLKEIKVQQCQIRQCRWFQGNNKCQAFPDGIPNEIAYGDHKHIVPYPGDHGIRYEKK